MTEEFVLWLWIGFKIGSINLLGFLNFKGPSFICLYFALLVVSVMQCVSTSERSSLKDFFESQVVNVKAAFRGNCWWLWPEPYNLLYVGSLNIYGNSQCASHSERYFRRISSFILCNNFVWKLPLLFYELTMQKPFGYVQHLVQGHMANSWLVRSTIKMLFFFYCSNYFLIKLRLWL